MSDPSDDFRALVDCWQQAAYRLEETHRALEQQLARLTAELEHKNRLLARRDRLADLGGMAAQIAHEIRNPLGAVELYLSLMESDPPNPPLVKGGSTGDERREAREERRESSDESRERRVELIEKARAAIQGLNGMVNDLLYFAGDRQPRLRMVDVRAAVEDALSAVARHVEQAGIDVGIDVPEGLYVRADGEMLVRALGT